VAVHVTSSNGIGVTSEKFENFKCRALKSWPLKVLILFRVAFVLYTGTDEENGHFDLQQFFCAFPLRRSSKYNNNNDNNNTLKHEIKELQTKAILCTEHIRNAGSANVKVQNTFHWRNNITCSTDCKYRTAATVYIQVYICSYPAQT
jgi:hypothetical protein